MFFIREDTNDRSFMLLCYKEGGSLYVNSVNPIVTPAVMRMSNRNDFYVFFDSLLGGLKMKRSKFTILNSIGKSYSSVSLNQIKKAVEAKDQTIMMFEHVPRNFPPDFRSKLNGGGIGNIRHLFYLVESWSDIIEIVKATGIRNVGEFEKKLFAERVA